MWQTTRIVFVVMMITFATLGGTTLANRSVMTVTVPTDPINESYDYATFVLGTPWDMSESTDISQYLNESGQRNLLDNERFENGVFSATSVDNVNGGIGNAYFSPLFPGYKGENAQDELINPMGSKIGEIYPINSALHHCLYFAMKVDSGPANAFGPDQFRIFWFSDARLNTEGAPYGTSNGIALYPPPEAPDGGAGQPIQNWKLFSMDLANPANGVVAGQAAWTSQATWQGLRIDPTINANINFQVDWVRLTDCNPNTRTVSWTPNGSVSSIWLRPVGTTRDIRVADNVNGIAGTHELDLQGVAAGSYFVGVGSVTECCTEFSAETITIRQAPIVTFGRPSFTSGADYAAQAGNAWDFNDTNDVTSLVNAPYTYQAGSLLVETPSGPLPAGVDVQINLNTPQSIDASRYRYLTFRMYTEWNGVWQNVPDGMIVRWVWSMQGTSGRPGFRCNMVSPDIAYDVGWQTYTVDLHSDLGGFVEEHQGECPAEMSWLKSGQVLSTRFDPNENVTIVNASPIGGGSFVQLIDWITLTQIDTVRQGDVYPIQISFNKPKSEIVSANFFYTTDLANPRQNVAVQRQATAGSGTFNVYLPNITRGTVDAASYYYDWNTAGVPAGDYYICAEVSDGVNGPLMCSDAQVRVTAP